MWLGDLIDYLKKEDPTKVLPLGFKNPHSYRGYYDCLAFQPAANVTVKEMLKAAEKANGSTYQGWKGGDYEMGPFSDCYIANMGCCGDEISRALLEFMFGRVPTVESFDAR